MKRESLPFPEGFVLVAGTGFSRFAIGPDVARGVDQNKFAQTEKVCA
jgi:hypothetical protein